jgi:N-acylneuraminate cytidylyltransferase
MKTTYAFIFARGGSKGVPRKNVRLLGGKPLIAHTIDLARSMREISKVIVSTDDKEIAEVSLAHGAEVPFLRPPELSGDNAPEWKAWQHAVKHVRDVMNESYDCFLSLPATSPLRSQQDVADCLHKFYEGTADMVIGVTPSNRSPYFNMVKLDGEGRASLVIQPTSSVSRRQDAPPVFDITTVAYAASPDFVLTRTGIFEGTLKTVCIPPERAVDIDTPFDLEMAEFLLERQKRALIKH